MQFALFVALFAFACATPLSWTGQGGNNLWDNYANWDPPGIPTIADDCAISVPGPVLIGTSNGAECGSLTVADGVAVSHVAGVATFGAGGVTVNGKSSVIVNAGSGWFNVVKASFADSATFTWQSGQVSGNLGFATNVLVTVNTNKGFANCISGSWSNQGTINIIGGSQFNSSCAIDNFGAINVESTDFPTYLFQIKVTPTSVGTVSIKGNVQANKATLNKVSINDGSIQVQPSGQVSIDGVKVSKTSAITSAEPSTTTISGLACDGAVAANGISNIYVKGNATVGSLQLNTGRISFDGSVQFGTIQNAGGILTLAQPSTVVSILTSDSAQFLGAGELVAQQATFGKYLLVACPIVIKQSAVLSTLQLTLDGSITVAENAVFTVSGALSFWGPTDATKPGTLANNGVFIVANPGATMNSLKYSGSGHVWVQDATVDFQNMAVTTPAFHLNASASVIKGESFKGSYDALYGPKNGSRIGVLVGSVFSTCYSPCGAYHTEVPIQTFWAKVVAV